MGNIKHEVETLLDELTYAVAEYMEGLVSDPPSLSNDASDDPIEPYVDDANTLLTNLMDLGWEFKKNNIVLSTQE